MTRFSPKFLNRIIAPLALSAAIAGGSLPLSTVAQAQSAQCGNREQIVKVLDKRFKEAKFAMGLASNVNLFEIFLSKQGTWTILSTGANGKACIVAAGKSWVSLPAVMKGDAVSF